MLFPIYSVKTNDELSLAQKKQVVTELKGFLKKSYNFSDESEYARAYEDLRQMFTTGSRKSISGLFENTVKKTGAHDSVKTEDSSYSDFKEVYNILAEALRNSTNTDKMVQLISKAQGKVLELAAKTKDSKTVDHAIRSCDISMYERIYQEAKAAVGGKYGIISNLSDLETAINDANRRGEKEDAKKLKEIYKKYN